MQYVTRLCCVGFFFPVSLSAGQIYGSVTTGGRAIARVGVAVSCGGAVTTGVTADDGSYRMNIPQQGRCRFEIPNYQGRPSADVFSHPNPAQYDFDLVRRPDGSYELRRR